MKASGARLRALAFVLPALVSFACSGDDPPADDAKPAAAGTSQAPSPSTESPGEAAAGAYRRFVIALRRDDARSAEVLMTRPAVRYLNGLRNVTAHAGAGAIEGLSPYEKLVVAVLRTENDPDLVEGVSTALFLELMLGGNVVTVPSIEVRSVSVDGARAKLDVAGWGPDVLCELEGTAWRVDGAAVLAEANDAIATLARSQGVGEEAAILDLATRLTGQTVTSAVWRKPS